MTLPNLPPIRSAISVLLVLALSTAIASLAAQPVVPTFAPLSPGVALAPSPRFVGSGIELADVTGDGCLDVVVSDNHGQFSYTHEFSVLVNRGDGSFAPPVVSPVVTEGNDFFDLALALGDLDGDGRADLVTTRLSLTTPPDGNRPNLAVLFGAGDGRFVNQVNLANSAVDRFMRRVSGRNVALGDMTGDHQLDVVSPASNNTFSVLPGNGDGTFAAPIQSGAGYAEILLLGDLDADGDLDVAGISNTGSDSRAMIAVVVNQNDGTGRLTPGPSFSLDTRVNVVHTGQARAFLADLDGDRRADLVVFGERGGQTGAGGIYVLRSQGAAGQFAPVFRETRGRTRCVPRASSSRTSTATATPTSPSSRTPAGPASSW